MNRKEFDSLPGAKITVPTIHSSAFREEKTLLYGYNVDRGTFHVYSHGGRIHLLIYITEGVKSYQVHDLWNCEDLIPNKRVYPERSDYKFCREVQNQGVRIPFLNYNLDQDQLPEPKQYYGKIHTDFELLEDKMWAWAIR